MAEENKGRFFRILIAVAFLALLALPIIMRHVHSAPERNYRNRDTATALARYGFYLEEVSGTLGIQFTHQSPELDPLINPILPQIASMGASVSVCDFDNDGWNDFYTTTSRFGQKNALYLNGHNGSFTDVAEQAGLADLNTKESGVSMGSVWADFDNDGFEDVFIYRWGKPALFKNENGERFREITAQCGFPGWINANTAIWTDYDADGWVDLFIGGYFPESIDLWHLKDTRVLTESFEYSQNGGRNYLFRNKGDGTFEDVTEKTGLTSTRWTLAAGSVDINRDGYPELFIANDYGIDEFYFNEKGKRYVEKSSSTMIGFSPKSGMNVSFGDVFNKGAFGVYISNITEEGILMQGNNFWTPVIQQDKIVYENEATKLGIASGGWSYCSQFGDLNNDGYLDLYLANGYISGKQGTDYWYDYAKVTGGNKAIISDIKNWPPMEGRSQSGYQQNKIWISAGSEFFIDAADVAAEKEAYDSRAVAMADLWNRGKLDVIVANQNGPVRILKNHVVAQNHWIAFELAGRKSNRSGIDAIVEVQWGNQRQAQVIAGGIGFCSQNQRRVQFGLGNAAHVDKVTVIWPGGKTQVIESPVINSLHKIMEP
jgi:enediyne biosynthesis protein E4